MQNTFALNHQVAPGKSLPAFLDLAVASGVRLVELRNDLPGIAIADGTPAAAVKAEADKRGLAIVSINALQRFNDWTAERAGEARDLIAFAQASGASALVLCPLNDAAYRASEAERLRGLREALAALAPMLRDAGVMGLVEPLGFAGSSLRLKREAVDAIDTIGASDVFRLVHDTFHHHLSGETQLFPEHTGLAHLSGVVEAALSMQEWRDAHRGLPDAEDLIDNVGQAKALMQGGYGGPLSLEPFAESVAALPDATGAVTRSLHFLRDALGDRS